MLIWRKSVTYRMCVHIFWYFKIQFMSINSCVHVPPFLFSLQYWCIFIALSGIIYRSQFDLCQSVACLCPTQNCHQPITLHFPFLFVNFAQPPRSLCSMQWCMGLPMRVCHNEKMRKSIIFKNVKRLNLDCKKKSNLNAQIYMVFFL